MATIHDVASRAGVSSITVSRFFSGNAPVSQETRLKIEEAVQELGYVPNALARGLKLKGHPTRTLGLIVSDVSNPFFTLLARGVEDIAHEARYSLILCNSDEYPDKQDQYLSVLHQKRVDGVILAPTSADPASIIKWSGYGPICLVDRILPGINYREQKIDSVRADSVNASQQLTAHLISHEHRRIAIINGPLHLSTCADRLAGYRQALLEAGLQPDPELELAGQFTVESGREMALELLNQANRPTAIFATNNFLTIGVLAAARDLSLEAPRSLAVAGFDDIPQLALIMPFITVAAQPARELGRQAAIWLLERMAMTGSDLAEVTAGREMVLPTEIIIRRSCGCNANG